MLLGNVKSGQRRVAVLSRSAQFSRLLGSLLSGWKYRVVDAAGDPSLAFVERGMNWNVATCRTIWLSPLPLAEEEFLTVPISLVELYRLAEQHFFPSPRRHIRFGLDLAIDLHIGEDWIGGRMISLSGRGARISCPMELPAGRALHVEVRLDGKMLRLQAEVLYCIPAGDLVGREEPHVGVLFKLEDSRMFDLLQKYVERRCIVAACEVEGIAAGDPCLSWFDLAISPAQN